MRNRWIGPIMGVLLLTGWAYTPAEGDARAQGAAVPEKAQAAAKTAFDDVAATHWAAEAIEEMARVEIINGYDGNVFRPSNPVTREEFAVLLAKTFDLESVTDGSPAPAEATFADVAPGRWSFDAIEAAELYFPGDAESSGMPVFEPKAEATREDVAAAIARTLGYAAATHDDTDLRVFRDAADVAPGVRDAVAAAIAYGIVGGYADGTFRPQATITRAETAAILYRAVFGPLETGAGTADEPAGRPDTAMPAELITDFSDADGWYGTVAHTGDVSRIVEGASSIILSTDADNTTTAARLTEAALDLSRARNLMVRLYVEDLERLSKFEVRVSADPAMKAYLRFAQTKWQLVEGWNEVLIPVEAFDAEGDASLERVMTTVQVSITQRGDLPVSAVFDALYRDYAGKGKVMIQFDDGWSSVYSKAFPMMQAKGFSGSFGIVTDFIGTKNYATLAQLDEMYAAGWDMFNHTATHASLTGVSAAEAEEEVRAARAFLLRHRMARGADYLAYPYGDYNEATVDIVARYSRYARTVTGGYELDPPINPHRLKAIELVNGIEPAVYQDAIRTAAREGSTVIFFLHRIEDAGEATSMLHTADFQAFLDELDAQRGTVDIMTVSQWAQSLAH
ncbi:S-layer homology domain-containing protein [Paenibacillus sp. IB182496]|uniref:S-layer homology domain-containing protein n=1 Tax=Paenibacillus sabuli TaxID=2772509 RepID=A0A927GSZ7_9BACL|nr:S-layer homology domain-containing protein [Paenibacillus sabuli]MBD2847083.1 S-layer homology domain-containing protein [Paenibacillus sabuli]